MLIYLQAAKYPTKFSRSKRYCLSFILNWHILGRRSIMPSTVIQSFDYDASRQVLKVVFLSGSIYEYLQVPEETFLRMKTSTAKGEFLNRIIKKEFPFRKVK
jgi:hypothetical protein